MSTDTLSRETASSVSPTSMDAPTLTNSDATVGERLQNETTAVRLKIHWPGVRKTLSQDQTRQAAGTFDADIKSVSASKKLLDTGHPAFRAASAVRTQAADYWKQLTLPYVEPGMRLIRRRDITAFDDRMSTVRDELAAAVEQLERHYDEMIDQARERLGDLFDAGDYATKACGINSALNGTTPALRRRSICCELVRSCTTANANGCSSVSTKRFDWPNKRLPTSSASWSVTWRSD